MEIMKAVLNEKLDINEELFQILLEKGVQKTGKRGNLLFKPDRIFDKMLFIESGILRGFRLDEGSEYTHHFFTPNWFAADYKSYLTGESGQLYIEAITDVSYYVFSKSAVDSLFRQHQEFEKLGRIIAENAYLHMVERLVDFQTNDLKERYLNLMENNNGLINEVPQKYSASYLGVAEQSLSRIKMEIAKQ
jgi:hypothetical protein